MDSNTALTAYVDGDHVVLCDPKNPAAWIRSDTVQTVGDVERVRGQFETA